MRIDYKGPLETNIVISTAFNLEGDDLEQMKRMGLRQRGFDPDRPLTEELRSPGVYHFKQLPEDMIAGQVLNRIHIARRSFMEKFNQAPDTVYVDFRLEIALRNFPEHLNQMQYGAEVSLVYGMELVPVHRDDYVAVGLVYTE